MKIKESKKIINGVPCFDVVKKGVVIKTFVSKAHAEAFISEEKISNYTQTKTYKEEMTFVNYYGGDGI